MTDESNIIRDEAGTPMPSFDTSTTVGPGGPVVMEDFQLFEKMAHFNRERIPERVVHATGAGAYGTFRVTNDITQYTRAKLFSDVGKETEIFVRFSQVAKPRGGSDIYRDLRGFAVKFYTEDGNWDLTGNNTPVFFVRDPMKFMDFIRSQKEHPKRHWRQDEMWWDFWSLSPESLHQVIWLMGDRGAPKGYGHMNGYGSHTFSLINADGERVWVKFHYKTDQGIDFFTDEEWKNLAGREPSWNTKQLYHAIEEGNYPSWTLYIQVMTDEQARYFKWDPFDLTKVWPHADFPLIEVGRFELNRNPENYFAEVEQSAFSPGNVVPGISYSPDRMLQARILSYTDTHRYRLGVNYQMLPVNAPKAARTHNYTRDGFMRFDDNGGGRVNYYPNSKGGPEADPGVQEPPYRAEGGVRRYPWQAEDHYEQPRAFYRLQSEDAKNRLIGNIVGSLGQCSRDIQQRQVALFSEVDETLGNAVEQALKQGQ